MKPYAPELLTAKKNYFALPLTMDQNKSHWEVSLGDYKPLVQDAIRLDGEPCDTAEFDDNGTELFGVAGGPHHGHTVLVTTAKYNCGAYAENHMCSCGALYMNEMHGCWQQGHQREEEGTPLV